MNPLAFTTSKVSCTIPTFAYIGIILTGIFSFAIICYIVIRWIRSKSTLAIPTTAKDEFSLALSALNITIQNKFNLYIKQNLTAIQREILGKSQQKQQDPHKLQLVQERKLDYLKNEVAKIYSELSPHTRSILLRYFTYNSLAEYILAQLLELH